MCFVFKSTSINSRAEKIVLNEIMKKLQQIENSNNLKLGKSKQEFLAMNIDLKFGKGLR
jgi:mannitol/fructose-specific phosphotransferase system IIA component (Ntr-type)